MKDETKFSFWHSEALYFGIQEVFAFLFFFLSPFLTRSHVAAGWLALAFWKLTALAALIFLSDPQSGASFSLRFKARFLLVLRAFSYSFPFALSALLFPVQAGQLQDVGRALALYVVASLSLTVLSLLRRQWIPALLGCLTLLWLGLLGPRGFWDYLIPLPVLLMAWRDQGVREEFVGDRFSRLLALLACAGWALCLFLSSSAGLPGLENLSRGLLVWLLVAGVSTVFLTVLRSDHSRRALRREVELSAPGLTDALAWLHCRRLLNQAGPWVCLALLFSLGPKVWLMGVAAVLAVPGLVLLGGRRDLARPHLHWWCTLQFVVFWGIAETEGWGRSWWVLLQILVACYLYKVRRTTLTNPEFQLCLAQSHLEKGLVEQLRFRAPPHLLKDTMKQLEPSVDIDASLSSRAPSGFRDRLLERLKQAEVTEDHD